MRAHLSSGFPPFYGGANATWIPPLLCEEPQSHGKGSRPNAMRAKGHWESRCFGRRALDPGFLVKATRGLWSKPGASQSLLLLAMQRPILRVLG